MVCYTSHEPQLGTVAFISLVALAVHMYSATVSKVSLSLSFLEKRSEMVTTISGKLSLGMSPSKFGQSSGTMETRSVAGALYSHWLYLGIV